MDSNLYYKRPYWYAAGSRQFVFLLDQGLLPSHSLLDVGCSTLRVGIHLIRYLAPNNYWGLEKEEYLISKHSEVCEYYNITKTFTIIKDSNFSIRGNPKFNYILAQSVFTHLDQDKIYQCVKNVMSYLQSSGMFFASYEPSKEIFISEQHADRSGEYRQTAFPFSFFQKVAYDTKCNIENCKEWGHPGGLHMLKFTRSE